jgi:hypothetical protein
MKVTGYKLREALRRWQLRRDTAAGQFPKVLTAFKDEKKPSPDDIGGAVLAAETAIASLQAAQAIYNSSVHVEVGGKASTLLECIKRIGGLGRVEKLWRTAATVKEDRYASLHESKTRKADEVIAERTVSYEAAGAKAAEFGKLLGAYREAIAIGNAREVEIKDLDAALLE